MIITCLGDSICHGYGVRPEESWVSLLAGELSAGMPGLRVNNAGVNGETAQDGLHRLAGLLKQTPDLLYVQFGLNDAAMGEPIDEYIETTREITRQALESGVRCVLLATNHPVSPEEYFPGGEAYRNAATLFNAALREAFASSVWPVLFVDVERMCEELGGLHEQAQLLQYDGDHLNPEGNRAYCRMLAPIFRDCLSTLQKNAA